MLNTGFTLGDWKNITKFQHSILALVLPEFITLSFVSPIFFLEKMRKFD